MHTYIHILYVYVYSYEANSIGETKQETNLKTMDGKSQQWSFGSDSRRRFTFYVVREGTMRRRLHTAIKLVNGHGVS